MTTKNKPYYCINPCTECIWCTKPNNILIKYCRKSKNEFGQMLSITSCRKLYQDCESFEQKRKENESLH